jgi:hypothetical protein
MSIAEYERRPAMPLGERLAYFFGLCRPGRAHVVLS